MGTPREHDVAAVSVMHEEAPGELRRRSVTIAGHRTSISLENAFWWELKRIARREGKSLNRLIAEVDARRERNLSSSLRVYVLEQALRRPMRHDGLQ